eukprot:TRINITY_DN3136_c1_g1_i4.p1 TRINITY_DN3136_c1_g1~~TRINITY_DN3136_c1_g1_i4.p1  ORF type:complete len:1377 (-),score=137.85 TRINITY_DN3136_c1_g1_i4:366-4496(-)
MSGREVDLQVTRSQSLPGGIEKIPSIGLSNDYYEDNESSHAGVYSARASTSTGIQRTTQNQLWQIQKVVTDIRTKGHNAQSHREKIAHLLGAAQIAVSALEWYAQMQNKPQLPRLLGTVLRELEVASTLIDLYGFHSKLKKAATVFSRNSVQQKFAKVTQNLQDISSEIWQVREVEVQSLGRNSQLTPDGNLTPTPGGGSYAGSERGIGDEILNAKLVSSRRIHRGKYGNLMKKWLGSKPSVTAMVYVPNEEDSVEEGNILGCVWWAQDSNLFVHDLSDDNTKELERQQDVGGVIQCMQYEHWRGLVWMGTSDGNVMVYHDMRGEPVAQQIQISKVGVTGIYVEQKDQVVFGFVGCQNGAIYSIRLDQAPAKNNSGYSLVFILGQQLYNQRYQLFENRPAAHSPMPSEGLEQFVRQNAPKNKKALYTQQGQSTSSARGAYDSDSQSEAVMNATEEEFESIKHEEIPDVNDEEQSQTYLQAHKGSVYCIMYIRGKLWTSAGSQPSNACIRLWQDVSRNRFEMSFKVLSSWDCGQLGAARCMCALKWPPIPTAYYQLSESDRNSESKQYEKTERVLTGHENGQILVWDTKYYSSTPESTFRPILKVGQPCSPIRGLVLLEQLGIVCAGHADGELQLRRFSSSMDKFLPGGKRGSSNTHDNKVTVIHPRVAKIQAHRNGMALCVGGGDMIITAGWFGTVRQFPEAYLRSELEQAQINTLPPSSPGIDKQHVSMRNISQLLRHMNPDTRDMVSSAMRDAKRRMSGSYSEDESKGKPATGSYRPQLNTVNSNFVLKEHLLTHASSVPNMPAGSPSPRPSRSRTPLSIEKKRGSELSSNMQSTFTSQRSGDSYQGSIGYESNSYQQRQDMDEAFSEFLIDYSEIKIQHELGNGSFGRVHKAIYNETTVAVKILQTPLIGEASHEMEDKQGSTNLRDDEPIYNLKKEVGVLYKIRHPNVVNFMGLCLSPPCVITEFCDRGSLFDVLKDCRESSSNSKATNKMLLGWVRRLQMLLDAAKGMLNLHKHKPPIVHRDLKSPNLLVTKDWTVKVADFNLSRFLDASQVVSKFTANNPLWQAPEVIKGGRYTKQSDVYAFGIIMWEVMTAQPPWGEDVNFFAVMQSIIEQDARPVVEDDLIMGANWAGLEDYQRLMQNCWDTDPKKRPSFSDIAKTLKILQARAEREESLSQKMDAGNFTIDQNQSSFNSTMSYSARRFNFYDSDVQVDQSPFQSHQSVAMRSKHYVGPQLDEVIKEVDELSLPHEDSSGFLENSQLEHMRDSRNQSCSQMEQLSAENSGSMKGNLTQTSQNLPSSSSPKESDMKLQQQLEPGITNQLGRLELQGGQSFEEGNQIESQMMTQDSLADLLFGGGPFGQQKSGGARSRDQ